MIRTLAGSKPTIGFCHLAACSFRWFIVAESTVRWFVVREKHC
jgi:hypothetical protein